MKRDLMIGLIGFNVALAIDRLMDISAFSALYGLNALVCLALLEPRAVPSQESE